MDQDKLLNFLQSQVDEISAVQSVFEQDGEFLMTPAQKDVLQFAQKMVQGESSFSVQDVPSVSGARQATQHQDTNQTTPMTGHVQNIQQNQYQNQNQYQQQQQQNNQQNQSNVQEGFLDEQEPNSVKKKLPPRYDAWFKQLKQEQEYFSEEEPDFFEGNQFFSSHVDFQIYRVRYQLNWVDFKSFTKAFFRGMRLLLTNDERKLIKGGMWNQGQGSYGKNYATFRLLLRKDDKKQSEIDDLRQKLLQGIQVQYQEEDVFIPAVLAPTNKLYSLRIIRISNLPDYLVRKEIGDWIFPNIIQNLPGYKDTQYLGCFLRWIVDWEDCDERIPDYRSIYLMFTGGEQETYLTNCYAQILNEYFEYLNWAQPEMDTEDDAPFPIDQNINDDNNEDNNDQNGATDQPPNQQNEQPEQHVGGSTGTQQQQLSPQPPPTQPADQNMDTATLDVSICDQLYVDQPDASKLVESEPFVPSSLTIEEQLAFIEGHPIKTRPKKKKLTTKKKTFKEIVSSPYQSDDDKSSFASKDSAFDDTFSSDRYQIFSLPHRNFIV